MSNEGNKIRHLEANFSIDEALDLIMEFTGSSPAAQTVVELCKRKIAETSATPEYKAAKETVDNFVGRDVAVEQLPILTKVVPREELAETFPDAPSSAPVETPLAPKRSWGRKKK